MLNFHPLKLIQLRRPSLRHRLPTSERSHRAPHPTHNFLRARLLQHLLRLASDLHGKPVLRRRNWLERQQLWLGGLRIERCMDRVRADEI